jgi:tRNA nucleotidyltransferase (CCA-adding enzyme)
LNFSFEDIRAVVLREVTPRKKERLRVQGLASKIIEKVEDLARNLNFDITVRLEGSLAKDTWLSGEADIDIFMEFPPDIERRKFEDVALEIAHEAMKDYRSIERFAEHPYLEGWMDGTRVNIVPCYKVKQDKWKSATDRTPITQSS